MTILVAGANTAISHSTCTVQLESKKEFGRVLGAVWLPLGVNKQVVTSPAYLHETKDWATVIDENSVHPTWKIDLNKIFEQHQAEKLHLITYCYFDPNLVVPAVELDEVTISINAENNEKIANYPFKTQERHIKSCKMLELYKRNGQYKVRALAEYSSQSLQVFSDRLEISLDSRYPQSAQESQLGSCDPQNTNHNRPRPTPGQTWTGTAFAIDPYHLLTCEHVTDGASTIILQQQGQADIEAQLILSDAGSDTALIKVQSPLADYIPLRVHDYDLLGEDITTLGFPLSGVISSQLQVTQGCIAGLQGIHNDIRFLQFTAPIQPGSSGSPLILPTGEVVGMVTASIVHEQAQNMNFAVKYQLLSALTASSGLNLSDTFADLQKASPSTLSTPQLTKKCKSAVWLVGCKA